jgi:hypothetical protein
MIEPELLTKSVDYTASESDKGKALDEAVAWAMTKGWEINLICWKEEDDKGRHVFEISYNKKPTPDNYPTRRR